MFARHLKQLRTEKNLLQKDLACILGVSTSAYGFYEQGKRQPDLDTLCKLADYFGVSIDYLLDRTTPPADVVISADEMQLLSRYRKMQTPQKDALQKIAESIVPCESVSSPVSKE